MKRSIIVLVCMAMIFVAGASSVQVHAVTATFTASGVKDAIGDLNNTSYQWGLWSIRAMPVVSGGSYTLTSGSGSTTQAGWGTAVPNGAFGASPYTATNSARFYDQSGAEAAGVPSNPLYMIMDVPAGNFWSTSFDKTGAAIADYSPGAGGTWYASGYDAGAGGTNLITSVADSSTFSFSFTLGEGATWDGKVQFVVDGSRYSKGTYTSPGAWLNNGYGGYTGGYDLNLAGNYGAGYTIAAPEPGALMLLITAGLGVLAYAWRRGRN